MPKLNPYTPTAKNNAEGLFVEGLERSGNHARVLAAGAVGLTCCFVGPIFLTFYYLYYGNDFGAAEMLLFFTVAYLAPGLLFVSVGLLFGYGISFACRSLSRWRRRVVVATVGVCLFGSCIYLLLDDYLNFAVQLVAFDLPAFSVACGIASLIITAVDLSSR